MINKCPKFIHVFLCDFLLWAIFDLILFIHDLFFIEIDSVNLKTINIAQKFWGPIFRNFMINYQTIILNRIIQCFIRNFC